MIGHPAIAYLVAQRILDERREEAHAYRTGESRREDSHHEAGLISAHFEQGGPWCSSPGDTSARRP